MEPPPLGRADTAGGAREASFVLDEHELRAGPGQLHFSDSDAASPAQQSERSDTVDGVWGAAGAVGVIDGIGGVNAGGGGPAAKGGAGVETCEVVVGDARYAQRVEDGLALLSQVRLGGATLRELAGGCVGDRAGVAGAADEGAGDHAGQRGVVQLPPRRHGPRRRPPHPGLRAPRPPPLGASRPHRARGARAPSWRVAAPSWRVAALRGRQRARARGGWGGGGGPGERRVHEAAGTAPVSCAGVPLCVL